MATTPLVFRNNYMLYNRNKTIKGDEKDERLHEKIYEGLVQRRTGHVCIGSAVRYRTTYCYHMRATTALFLFSKELRKSRNNYTSYSD